MHDAVQLACPYGCPGYVRIRDAMQGIQIEHEDNRGHRKLTSVYLHDGLEFLVFSEEPF